ncbi:MAG: sensor histidine kinase [Solirubrobacteraceae bacterium]
MSIAVARQRLRGVAPRAIDVAVAVAVAVAMTLIIAVAQEDGSRPPNAPAYLLGLTLAALLLARRRHPLLVLAGSVGALCVYYSLNYPAFSPAVPLAVASYSAAVAGRLLPAAVIDGVLVTFGAGWQNVGEGASLLSVLGTQTLADVGLLAAVLLLGEAVRNRRAWAEEVRRRQQRAAEDRDREAARRVEQERLRIARELHDVMAHTIAAMNVQAAVACDTIDPVPDQTRVALQTIRAQGREAMAELRATVGLLRGDAGDAPRSPAPGLAGLGGLVRTAAAAGVDVDLAIIGAARPLPAAIDLTAYRILQESLTNVVRHAGACATRVEIRYEADEITLEINDDGRGNANGAAAHDGGYGLMGMRERATAVGGTLQTGPANGNGFRVHARLPTRTSSP